MSEKRTMKDKDPIYKRFWTALKHEVDLNWDRQPSTLAAEIGVKPSSLTAILNGKTKAKYENRSSLAKACGYEYEAFLEYGKSLLGENEKVTIKESLPEESKETPAQGQGEAKTNQGDKMNESERLLFNQMQSTIDDLKAEKADLKAEIKKLNAKNEDLYNQLLEVKRSLPKQRKQPPSNTDAVAKVQ